MKYLIFMFSCLLLIASCSSHDNKAEQIKKSEAFVNLSFDLNEAGKPINIVVLNSEPKKTFDAAAIRALSKWEYKPKIVEGKAVIQRGLTVRLDFNESK